MEKKDYKEALTQLGDFIKQREELTTLLEDSIDKYIMDRTLPFDYKEKYVEWQQDLLDITQSQIKDAKAFLNKINSAEDLTD